MSMRVALRPQLAAYKDFHTGELKKVRRRPARVAHDMLPTDVVELSRRKNVDWTPGEEYVVKHISPRNPNVIQISNDEGESTFVSSTELESVERVASRGEKRVDDPVASAYLLWP